ncbi:DUF4124 domain-containing protein [Parendozoicomonas haliclonae]|uniref:DUF4124 domain-containing protein n=1 Tax=Parendozoicomonas haliclonae TaxID=1960125 RepID=A0A1X7AIR9_9GAMM|nr:DUF4124 domain-containing protein [Parendozoicomonas haliclonae]SMA44812.1 hypothetical protein EHSB41UT_01802 [Parendozoicomonas haliclonae]
MKKLSSLLLAAVLCSAGASIATANDTVYRWIDDKGTPHYSKQPPVGVQYEVIKTTKARAPQEQEETREEDSRSAAAEPQDKYAEQLNRLARQQNESCQRAKQNKERLLNNHRIQITEADGSLRTLSYDEKMEQLKKTDEAIQEYCTSQ